MTEHLQTWTVTLEVRDDGVRTRELLTDLGATEYALKPELTVVALIPCDATRQAIAERVVRRRAQRLGMNVLKAVIV